MTIRAGDVLFLGGNTLLQRVQNIGPSLSIPEERIFEVGNRLTVAVIRDIPDLSFDSESFDVSCQTEALLTNVDPDSIADQQEFLLSDAIPLDVISPWRGSGVFTVTKGVALPYLTLESASYRFGVGQSAGQSFTLRGDAIYFIPGAPKYEVFAAAGTGPYAFGSTPTVKTTEQGEDLFAYCVTLVRSDGTYKRLFLTDDYTNTSTDFTLVEAAPAGSELHVVYGSTETTEYLQSVHASTTVKPAAVRGKDIEVYVSDGAATPTLLRWQGIQSAEINWRADVDVVEELGTPHVVARDYNTPEVSGSLTMKPESAGYLFARLQEITGVASTETINALSAVELEMQIRIKDPDDGTVLKTFVVDDAKFIPPASAIAANSRLELPIPFTSESGVLTVVNGTPA